ncbi:family 43 glycosylhydrolase [Mucilaginibacter daejeonensis]|uniref:family 43 glycosylhydrolase n=1 Tax=Mucilaginibacter daejeonensis TaxID=398049 RepID=UPI001D17BE52|nr:family 43 glycosylhydrolase [Mucilaginibacter daejeonensis]UEG52258.1 family 43 glycosylhydrolase [Mucilaginibacter daejeonensis]
MSKYLLTALAALSALILLPTVIAAQNPLITDQYTADPSARVFNGRVYIYPSHDIKAQPGKGRPGWFCMEDYHVFSSADMTQWTDHGVILNQTQVPWADPAGYAMWAPDCVARNGKYYFYFPATVKGDGPRKGFGIGVAVADQPYGPFKPQAEAIKGVHGIDPNVFIDKDGQAYLYWSQGNIYGAKLKENMLELDSEPKILSALPEKGLKEGPYLFERKGVYYMTYPHVENKIERLEYATATDPLGPFTIKGVIMDESPNGCWTVHHSIILLKDQWYLFYHDKDLSPNFDKNRSIRADSLFFNADGTIRKVTPTLRGVGITQASAHIQLDRYSAISPQGTNVQFIDTADRFKGWKVAFDQKGAWVRYNKVDLSKTPSSAKLTINAIAADGAVISIYADKPIGQPIARVKLSGSSNWKVREHALTKKLKGVHDLFVMSDTGTPVQIDWISFK